MLMMLAWMTKPQEDLPPGATLKCNLCGTRVRPGQPHSATEPEPHVTMEALFTSGPPDPGFRGASL